MIVYAVSEDEKILLSGFIMHNYIKVMAIGVRNHKNQRIIYNYDFCFTNKLSRGSLFGELHKTPNSVLNSVRSNGQRMCFLSIEFVFSNKIYNKTNDNKK